ncbi:hemerythrin domain-containing protein [Loktanella sp. SALINAS62]|uniref:hemerythrin domain-containing protein n=1 Tax=Loktanella sp. SALINAS62 TaxID=2706124 RepID=UPI001B8B5917|nr:hemerythrin domain-containing protein [Loktanella sp. SALINAS62]MBS1303093.1 hemerythrin domain-containing protein [Loktanella sp. SALINAS62]
MTDLSLESRDGLPDALRVLLDSYPREGWTRDPGFNGLISFWLDRHMMFRRLMAEMQSGTERLLDRKDDPQGFARQLSRYGGMFVNGLHEHHMIEDSHYFPRLQLKDDRIARGFEILDADHHALDGHLNAFAEGANATLRQIDDRDRLQNEAGAFRDRLNEMARLLNRHLVDEEELIVPVILKFGSDDLGG